jgi:hypothetical protein
MAPSLAPTYYLNPPFSIGLPWRPPERSATHLELKILDSSVIYYGRYFQSIRSKRLVSDKKPLAVKA